MPVLRATAVVPLLLAVGCGSPDPSFVTLPDHGAKTIVVAHRPDANSAFTLLIAGPAPSFHLEVEADSETFVLHYNDSAETLGLVEGSTPRCSLLVPQWVERLQGEQLDGFTDALPEGVRRALVEDADRCAPCRPVRMNSVNYPEIGTLGAGAWLDSERLVSGLESRFRRVDLTSSQVVEGCAFSEHQTDLSALERVSPGVYWFGSQRGDLGLVRFSDEATTCVVETSTVVPGRAADEQACPGILALAVNPFGIAVDDVYALLADGRLVRYRSGTIKPLGEVPIHPLDASDCGTHGAQFLFLEDGRALAISGWNKIAWWGPEGIEHLDDVELPPNQFTADGGQRVTALAVDNYSGKNRLLAGASSGLVLEFDPSVRSWLPLLDTPTKKEIRGLERFGDRWLLIVERGDIIVWHPDTGVCPSQFRIPLSTNAGRCDHRARKGADLAIFDALGDTDRQSGLALITDD